MAWSMSPLFPEQAPATGAPEAPPANDLTTNSATTPLAAAQGVVLASQLAATAAQIAALQGQAAAALQGNEPHALAITANGQTVFTLPTTPADPASVTLALNGALYNAANGDFTVAGTTVTWTNATQLATTDNLEAFYK